MKTLFRFALLIGMSVSPLFAQGRPGRNVTDTFIRATSNTTVVVTRRGLPVARLAFPAGTVLSVRGGTGQHHTSPSIEFEFHGDFWLRILSEPGIPESANAGQESLDAETALVMAARDVDVLITAEH